MWILKVKSVGFFLNDCSDMFGPFAICLFISLLQALVASGQDKERLIGDLQGENTTVDVVSLQNQLEKLKNELQDKNGLIFI